MNLFFFFFAIKKNKKELIFFYFGVAYLKFGFIFFFIYVFLEFIRLRAKNIDALSHLGLGFEKLKMYQKSLEVLDALSEQGVAVAAQIAYTKALEIKNSKMEFDKKIAKLDRLTGEFNLINRMILELYIANNKDINEIKSKPNLDNCIDILYLNDGVLDGDEYKELYSAKGLNNAQITDFNLNLLKVARDNNLNATLSFSYICKECKGSYPLFFYRCNHCARLGSCAIIPNVIKESDENSISF